MMGTARFSSVDNDLVHGNGTGSTNSNICSIIVHIANDCGYKILRFGPIHKKYQTLTLLKMTITFRYIFLQVWPFVSTNFGDSYVEMV